MAPQNEVHQLTAHLFRIEYGKMVAALTRIFGIGQLAIAEDIVQDTILLALKEWSYRPLPANPSAWLYVVAKNKAIDYLRRQKNTQKVNSDLTYLLESEYTLSATVHHIFLEEEIKDSQLRMMFALCHPSLGIESQICLVLKTLCGFSNDEIARAFLTNIETVNKRLYRAKEKLREKNSLPEVPTGKHLLKRLDAVLKSIYLLFNEGYHSSSGVDKTMRHDLCYEAMRLCHLLTEYEPARLPQVNALLSLMCFNVSRFNSRTDKEGNIVLYKNQNRSLWDSDLIERGNYYLNLSSEGEILTTYHIEAAIASFYCLSDSFEKTDWQAILGLYTTLEKFNPSPVVKLNKAIVLAYTGQAENAIKDVLAIKGLEKSPFIYATLGDLYVLTQSYLLSKEAYQKASTLTNHPQQKKLLETKISEL